MLTPHEERVLDAGEVFQLEADMKAWYQANAARWSRALFEASEHAGELAAKLRAGGVQPPPLGEMPPEEGRDELDKILKVLDDCVALRDRAAQVLHGIMRWAGKDIPGPGRPRNVAEDYLEERLAGELSKPEVQLVIDTAKGQTRDDGALARRKRARQRQNK